MAARGGRGHSRSGAATGDSECSGRWEEKKKRKRYQCKVILHGSSKEEPVVGFKRFAWTLKADPRLCEDAQRDLKQKSLADFRKQKRRREDDNLVDSQEGVG